MNIFRKITERTMRQNHSRTLVTIIGVVLSTAMIAAVTTFGVSIQQMMINQGIQRTGNWHIYLRNVSPQMRDEITENKKLEAFAEIRTIGYAEAENTTESDRMPYFYIQSMSKSYGDMVSLGVTEGRLPENESEIIIPEYLLANQPEEKRLKVGDTLELEVGQRMRGDMVLDQYVPYLSRKNPDIAENIIADFGGEESFIPQEKKTYTIVGIYDMLPLSLMMDGSGYELLTGPQTFKEEQADSYEMVVRMKSPWDVKPFWNELLEKYSDISMSTNWDVLRWYGIEENDNFLQVFVGLFAIVIVLIVAASISLIYNAFAISMRERTGQFGLLSSVGATKKQLRRGFRHEAWSVCLIGIPLGLFSGVAGIGITLHFIGPLLVDYMYGVNEGIPLKVSAAALGIAALIGFITVQISVWIPARAMKKISPLEAVRANQDIRIAPARRRFRKKAAGKGISGRLFGLEGMLASKNYKRDKRKYRTTVVSLTLSIVLFVTAGSYVLYLGQGSRDALQSAQMDISIDVPKDSNVEAVREELEQMEGIDEVRDYQRGYYSLRVPEDKVPENMRYLFTEAENGSLLKSCTLSVYPDDQFIEYAKEVGVNPDDYINQDELKVIYKDSVRMYDGETQKYSNATLLELEKEEELQAGDEAVTEDEGVSGKLEHVFAVVLGAQADSYPKASNASYYTYDISLIAAKSTFERAGAAVNRERFYQYFSVRAKNHRAVTLELDKKAYDGSSALYDSSAYDMKQEFEKNHNIMVVIRVLTTGFVVLMAMIAVANIFNTVSTNLYLRRREFAMLRSVGMTQKGFRKMMGCECLIYGLRSICYGILISAGSSYLVYRTLQSGVEFSYMLPWKYWLISIAAVLLVVGITMLYTMRKMQKDNVIDILKKTV